MAHTNAREREQASDVIQTLQAYEHAPTEQNIEAVGPTTEPLTPKIEALAEIICSAGDRYAGALLVLMGIMEQSPQPEVIAHTAKHLAFTRCGEFNLFGMVDAQMGVVEDELLAESTAGY